MQRILILLLLVSALLFQTGCMLAAGYVGATATKKHEEVDEEQKCLKQGGEWLEGNSWTFQSGECSIAVKE